MFVSKKDKFLPTDILSAYREHLKSSGYSTPTVKNYITDTRHLIIWVQENYQQFQFSLLNESSLSKYRTYLKEKFHSKPSIAARRLSSLRKFLNWTSIKGFVSTDLINSLDNILEKKTVPQVLPTPIQVVAPTEKPTDKLTEKPDLSSYKIHQKALHHIKNSRPGWYRAYHKKDWASTVHTVLMVLFFIAVGSLFFYSEVVRPSLDQNRDEISQKLGDVLAAASPPSVLSFQGRLTDSSDVPVTSSSNIVFKIYDAETGGTLLWTSKTWAVTPDQNGIFSVCLGNQTTTDDCLLNGVADTAFPATLFSDNAALYLQVEVETEILTPRQRIAAVSYALNSDALEGFHGSQSPGADEVPILNASGNLIFAGAATVGSGGAGTLTIDSASGTLILGAGTTTVSSGEATLVINAAGAVDIQDSVTVDSLTTDTGGITLLAGQAIVPSAAGGITIGNGSLTALTVTTDGSGDTEVALPAGSISGTEITDDTIVEADLNAQGTLTDEWCLTYETTGNPFEWQSCGGSQTPWTSDIDADGFDLNDLSNIEFRTTTGAPAGTIVSLFSDNTGDLNISALTGKTINLQVNAVDEFNFSSTELEFNSNNITGLSAITASGLATFTGNITANDASADTILIGQSGATDDTVTIAGDVSITDDNWSITAAGLITTASNVAVNGGTISSTAGTLIINATGAVDVQDSLNADSITSDAGISIAAGNSYTGAGAVTLSSAAANALTIDSGTTGAIDIGTGANAKTITLGNTTTTTTININSGTGGINLEAAGTGTTDVIQIGAGGAGGLTPDYLALDVKSDTGDPAGGAEGYIYYNTFDNKFRCFQSAAWTDCIGAGGTFSGEVDDTTNDALTFTGDDVSPPAGTVNSIFRDNTGDLNINTVTGKTLNVQIAGTDEYNFSDTALAFNSNNITGLGANLTATGALTIGTAGTGALTLDSDSGNLTFGAGTNTLVNADAATALLINPTGDLQFQTTSNTLTAAGNLTLAGTLTVQGTSAVIGSGGNTFTFDTTSGPTYAGTARPTRQVALVPEYAGATMSADGTSNTGTMTSDFCENGVSAAIPDTNTADCDSGEMHNYYQWTTSQGTAQDYTIWVRWRVPDNFAAWPTNPISVQGRRTDVTNNAVTVQLFDTANVSEVSTQVAGAANTWANTVLEATFAGTYTAGSYMTFQILMNADTSDDVQAGEITINYSSNN